MIMPNFLIIGSQSAGTTSVYNYLKQHPQVYVSPTKETNFFVYEGHNLDISPHLPPGVTTLAAYQALFSDVLEHKAIGEASPLYLVDPHAAERIRHYIPKARLIAILRDPAERAHTAYWMRVRDGRERRSFEQAIDQEMSGRFDESLDFALRYYVRWGLYATHLKTYLALFDQAQLAVYLFDDLRADPAKFMGKLFRFLEVDDAFIPDTSVRYNASGLSRSKPLQPLFRKSSITRALRRALPDSLGRRAASFQEHWRSRELSKPSMPPKLRRKLVARYQSEILELQGMIKRDLSRWLD
ncbi:MAG: sulfotransferase family protein [Geminicoccaceae bacterium]